MAQTTDITINAAGYMVEPGTYKRHQDGMAEGRTERISITDFFGGQHRALQLERDKAWDGLAVGPALGGQGVQPWPYKQSHTKAITTHLPNRDATIPYIIVRDELWFAIGTKLYRGPVTAPDTGFAWAVAKTFTNPIVDICIYASYAMLVSFGTAADIVFYNPNTGTDVVLFPGERGNVMEAYAGHAAWSDSRAGGRPTILRLVSGSGFDERAIDHDPIAMTVVGAELCVVTKQALYTFNGRVKEVQMQGSSPPIFIHEWSGEWSPFFQQGVYTERDDFRMLLGFGGKTIAWIAGGVHELVPSGDRAGWRSTGLSGRRCFGGCVAAGYVVVSIESHAGMNELWAYDGNGWWKIDSQAMPAGAGTWCNPMPVGSGAIMQNVMVFNDGAANVQTYRLVEAVTTSGNLLPNYPPTAEFVTPLIDAGERDKAKAWRKVGAVFASPELRGNQASTDVVAIYLDYSTDSGATWTQADSYSAAGNSLPNMNFDLEQALSGAISTFLMLRVRWVSVSSWAPILVGVWAEYEVLDNPARRRKWDFKIHAHDQTIDRDGVVLTRTGRQLITELWDAWENDDVVTLRDIDYDTASVTRNVRIVGISEAVDQPADSNEWGESIITMRLVEV